MSLSYSHGREFVQQVRPFLEKHDPEGLVAYLKKYWPHHQLRELLSCDHEDAVKVAVACLSLCGNLDDNIHLAPLLHDEDASVVSIAEHAMWSIWFQSGDEGDNARLQRAVRLISQGDLDSAIDCLNRLLARRPSFAEACNQRAIAYFLKEDYAASLKDCLRALRLNPFHFGAMAGVGHCHASMGELDRAMFAYARALQMHPQMEGIRQSVHHLRRKIGASAPPSAKEAHS